MGRGVRKGENGGGRETDRIFWKRSLCSDCKGTFFLNAWVINSSMKGSDGSAIEKRMKLMKRRLCLKITAILGNSKSHYCSW